MYAVFQNSQFLSFVCRFGSGSISSHSHTLPVIVLVVSALRRHLNLLVQGALTSEDQGEVITTF